MNAVLLVTQCEATSLPAGTSILNCPSEVPMYVLESHLVGVMGTDMGQQFDLDSGEQ
jgi:hypothetical protein